MAFFVDQKIIDFVELDNSDNDLVIKYFENVYIRAEMVSDDIKLSFVRKEDGKEELLNCIGHFESGDHKILLNDLNYVFDIWNSKLNFDEICERAENHNKTILNYNGKDSKGDKNWHVRCNICENSYVQRSRDFYKCKQCSIIKNTKTFDEFKIRAIEVHEDKYTYSPDGYVNTVTKINIFCNSCNKFFLQLPHDHLMGSGCPICRESKGERAVKKVLEEFSIVYTRQKTYDGLFHKGLLRYDFYLDDYNKLIEYDGEQHFGPINFCNDIEKANENYESTKFKDKLKTDWAYKNDISLLRIPYWEINNVREIVIDFLRANNIM